MKTVFLIHGYNGVPKIYEWLKTVLEEKGFRVFLPIFPPQTEISYESWSKILDISKTELDGSIVVAHSVGNPFIIEYCTRNNLHLSTYISLAGFGEYFENAGRDDLNAVIKRMAPTRAELEKFQHLANSRYSIFSDNDHIVPFETLEKFPKQIDSTPILIKGIGHMGKKSGLEKIPEVVEIIEGEENA